MEMEKWSVKITTNENSLVLTKAHATYSRQNGKNEHQYPTATLS